MCLAATRNRTTIRGCPSHGLFTIATAYNIPARMWPGGGGGRVGEQDRKWFYWYAIRGFGWDSSDTGQEVVKGGGFLWTRKLTFRFHKMQKKNQ